MPKEKKLDPAGTRSFLANIRTRMAHSTDSGHIECAPEPSDNIGFADNLPSLRAQKFIPCPLCLPGEYQ